MVKKKTIINIACGYQQICLIKKIKDLGFAVIGIDQNPASPGLAYCDESILCSTHDADSIIKCLNQYQNQYLFKGVVTKSSGIPVITVAKIAQNYHLPGISPQTAETLVDKSKFINYCDQFHLPIPNHQAVKSLSQLSLSHFSFPLVIKPSLCSGGKKGVMLINNQAELIANFLQIQSLSANKIVEVEDYLEGQEILFVGLVFNKKLFKVTLLEEIVVLSSSNNFISQGFQILKTALDSKLITKLNSIAQQFVSYFSLENTYFTLAFKLDHQTPKLIEAHLDLGGDNVADILIPQELGIDIIKQTIYVCTGKKPSL